MGKVKMAVVAHFTFDKKVLPIKIKSEDGATFTVDKVLDVRPAASLKAGGSGIRYICDCTTYQDGDEIPVSRFILFRDEDEWYSEVED